MLKIMPKYYIWHDLMICCTPKSKLNLHDATFFFICQYIFMFSENMNFLKEK